MLDSRESKMTKAGMAVESYADVLDRKFWATIPEQGKKSVLLSADMWCIPARNIRAYIEELIARGCRTFVACGVSSAAGDSSSALASGVAP